MKSARMVRATALCPTSPSGRPALSGCAKKNMSNLSVEGPKNKYEVKLEKTEKGD